MRFEHFRLVQSAAALLTHAILCAGALGNSLTLVGIGMVFFGISMAGGNLAWNLGQNAFASAERLPRYMGAHVTLTGLRGMFFPFVGTLLFEQALLHRGVYVLTTLLCATALAGYVVMARRPMARFGDSEQLHQAVTRRGEALASVGPSRQ
jgi:hypothetical protein